MKKQLLIGALLLGSLFTAQAQGDSCAGAQEITPGSYVVASWPGAAPTQCYGSTTDNAGDPLMGAWYKFTPSTDGYIAITSVLAGNDPGSLDNPNGIDTRVSLYTGTCDALACYTGNDDIASDDWRSELTGVPVAAGSTYYIVWENFWQEAEFDFQLSFEAATCLYPNDLTIETSNLATTSVTVSWGAAVGNPESYDFLYGPEGFDPETEGENINTQDTSVNITDQTVGASIDYYIRSVCGAGDTSEWIGPFNEVLATTAPYENSFESLEELVGFRVSGFGWTTDSDVGFEVSHTPEGFVFSNVSATAATDARLFLRPIYLQANQQISVGFYAAYPVFATANFEVTIGTSRAIADQTVIGSPFELEGTGGIEYTEFLTENYVAPASGVYYIVIHNTSPAAGTATSLLFDTLVIDSELGTDSLTGNKLSVYPNPSTDVVNVANAGLINSVKVADLNGRTVKAVAFDGVDAAQVSIADIASGVYMMTVASDKGTNTTKIVKN